MNLLRIQDALKNASDQQLMQMMQAPDSTAPSYLVLSELRRRKDMRSQQAPEGESRRTVAEELLAQDDGGIRNIVAHDEPEAQEGADEMAAGGLASLRGYREGGVVRMQTGGQPPPYTASTFLDEFGAREYPFVQGSSDPIIFGRPLHSYSLEELQRLRADERAGVTRARGSQLEQPSIPMGEIDRRIAVLRGRTGQRFAEPEAPRAGLGDFLGTRMAETDQVRGPELSELLPATTTETAQTQTQPQPPAPTTPTTPTQPQGQQQGQQQQPAPAARTAPPAQGIGALRTTGAEGAEANPPNVQFTDRLSPLFERMREGRVDPSARRNEALNMALIEAGLRIAGSRNPSLAGALGEGATPAVQSYAQQLGQIRADQRQDLRDELQGALAQNQNDYYRGRLSQQEFATRQQMLIERLRQSGETGRTMLREDRADARNAATIAGQREPASVQELRYLENLYNTDRAAFERAIRARQTGLGAAELRDETSRLRLSEQRQQAILNPQNRNTARMSLLRSGNSNPSDADINAWIMSQLGAGGGGLPMSNTPTGPGGVVRGVQ